MLALRLSLRAFLRTVAPVPAHRIVAASSPALTRAKLGLQDALWTALMQLTSIALFTSDSSSSGVTSCNSSTTTPAPLPLYSSARVPRYAVGRVAFFDRNFGCTQTQSFYAATLQGCSCCLKINPLPTLSPKL